MMRGFLFFVLFLVIGAGLYQLIAQGSGYILIVWGKTSIETSLWFALVSSVFLLFSVWLLWTFFSGGFKGVIAAKRKVFGIGDEKAQAKTVDGLIDYIEENWVQARRKLTRSAGKVKAPIINYLAAARSAYELGDEQEALALLHQAENSNERGGLAVAITQARMQLANQQYEQALATLERASAIKPEHPVVLNLRQQVYVALKDWTALKALLPQLNKHKIGSSEYRHQLEKQLYYEKLQNQINKHTGNTNNIDALEKVWQDIPNHLQREESIVSLYVAHLMTIGKHHSAETLLSSALDKQWHGQWLDLYGLLNCQNPEEPLKKAEKWLTQHPNNSHLLLALGRLCIQNKQWGRAVDFLEKSLSLHARPEVYAELSRLLEHLGETEKSIRYCKQGLMASTRTLSRGEVFQKS